MLFKTAVKSHIKVIYEKVLFYILHMSTIYITYAHGCIFTHVYQEVAFAAKKKKKMKSHFTCLKRTTKRHLLIWEFFSTIIFFKLDIIIYFMYLSSQIEHKHASSPHIISQKWHLLLNTFRTIKKWFPNWGFTWWFAKIFAKIITWVCHHWLAVVPSSELATAVFL